MNEKYYWTTNLKLAALLLAEIVSSRFEIFSVTNSQSLKSVKIWFPVTQDSKANEIINEFAHRRARVDVYRYNMALTQLRDKILPRRENI